MERTTGFLPNRNNNKKWAYLIIETFIRWQKDDKVSKKYVTYRWIIAVSFWLIVLLSIGFSKDRKIWWAYLTNWGLFACLVATNLGAYIVTSVYLKQKEYNYDSLLVKPPNKLSYLYWVIYTIGIDEALIITVLYWTCVYPRTKDNIDSINVLVHGINTAIMVIDLTIIKQPVHIKHVFYSASYSIIYGFFNYFFYVAGGTNKHGEKFLYAVLDWENHSVRALLIIGVGLVGITVMHFFTFIIFMIRRLIFKYLYQNILADKEDIQCVDIQI